MNVNNEKRKHIDKIIDFRNINVNVSNEINKKINNAFFDRFENVTNLNIENFVVVLNEIDKIVIVKIVNMILFYFYSNFVSKR